jgi:hypothetical protein
MAQTPDPANYYWVIIEYTQPEETILGVENPDGGRYIPATIEKSQGELLMQRMPPGSVQRGVEAMHRQQLLDHASKEGYQVLLVDAEGKVIEALQPLDS